MQTGFGFAEVVATECGGLQTERVGHKEQAIPFLLRRYGLYPMQTVFGFADALAPELGGLQMERVGSEEQEASLLTLCGR